MALLVRAISLNLNIKLFKIKLILILTLLSQLLYGQENFIYRGLIIDSVTAKGIEGVHIILNDNNKLGSISNSDGAFILKSSTKLKALTFSHVGYKTYIHLLEDNPEKRLRIILKPSIKNLDQIIILSLSAKQIVLNAIERMETNHFIEPVYYEFFTRVANFSKDSVLNFLEEHSGYIYHKKVIIANSV